MRLREKEAMKSRRLSRPACLTTLAILLGAIALCQPGCASRSGIVSGQFEIFEVDFEPKSLAIAPDGQLWFTIEDVSGGRVLIGRMSERGDIERVPIAIMRNLDVIFPNYMIADKDGSLWVTAIAFPLALRADEIVRRSPSGSISRFSIPTLRAQPEGLTIGRDRVVWFAENLGDRIGRLSSNGFFHEYALPPLGPRPQGYSGPYGVYEGPDGSIWFTVQSRSCVGRLSTSGKVDLFPTPTRDSKPTGITLGADGRMWFSESGAQKIGAVDARGQMEEYAVPEHEPSYITTARNGDLWIADHGAGRICKFAANRKSTCYQPPNDDPVYTLVEAPNGDIWFTQANISRVHSFWFRFKTHAGVIGHLHLH